MARNHERNKYQITRQDGKNCFVEVRNDCFSIGKIHFEFVKYDLRLPENERCTDYIHIYLAVPEFLAFAYDILLGNMHARMEEAKQQNDKKPLYSMLGGTSAAMLEKQDRPREDGMSLSRCVKLSAGTKADYLFSAESGPGEIGKNGIIIPRYGANPEQRVSVGMSWRDLNKLVLTTKTHYEAWLSAQYAVQVRQESADNQQPRYTSYRQAA